MINVARYCLISFVSSLPFFHFPDAYFFIFGREEKTLTKLSLFCKQEQEWVPLERRLVQKYNACSKIQLDELNDREIKNTNPSCFST